MKKSQKVLRKQESVADGGGEGGGAGGGGIRIGTKNSTVPWCFKYIEIPKQTITMHCENALCWMSNKMEGI